MKILPKYGFFACVLGLALGFLPLYGCGGSDEGFSCNFTRSLTSGSMRMSVTYDCPDSASCDACTNDSDCSGCREVSRTGNGGNGDDGGNGDNGDNGGNGGNGDNGDDIATCSVGLELMSGESCRFNDGRNQFTINNTGSRCCLGSNICAGGTLRASNVVVTRNAEGDCVIESLP